MPQTENWSLHGVCRRLILGLSPDCREAMILARWIADHPEIFGTVPRPVPASRHSPGVHPEVWSALADYLSIRLAYMSTPSDESLSRLGAIGAHLGISQEEETVLSLLVIRKRQGPLANFFSYLQSAVGLSYEAAIGWCCNLDENEVWKALAPNGRLVRAGLILTDNSSPEKVRWQVRSLRHYSWKSVLYLRSPTFESSNAGCCQTLLSRLCIQNEHLILKGRFQHSLGRGFHVE